MAPERLPQARALLASRLVSLKPISELKVTKTSPVLLQVPPTLRRWICQHFLLFSGKFILKILNITKQMQWKRLWQRYINIGIEFSGFYPSPWFNFKATSGNRVSFYRYGSNYIELLPEDKVTVQSLKLVTFRLIA
jgi:hypothetical protein